MYILYMVKIVFIMIYIFIIIFYSLFIFIIINIFYLPFFINIIHFTIHKKNLKKFFKVFKN